eukprot:TRINITY_DN4566_c0_g1_i1.p1 TRINITY_DN4566_c0_g1~~TRINITY_DN4566_c0_g1_i1.p1  ORF type:complete len:347 (+),score=61.97 TRINITY_DN4566_c0_g1_i1:103-1143(+)
MDERHQRLLNLAREYLNPLNLSYELTEFIGSGAFATVWKASHKETGAEVAIKVIEKNNKSTPFLENERRVWEAMDHPYVVKLLEVIDVPSYYIFISEYIPSAGNLYQVMRKLGRPFTSEETRKIFRQVLEAVAYMHQRGYAHRDLKLENILWDESSQTIKLLDFGLSIPARANSNRYSGSPHYSPPEIFLHSPYDAVAADVWSLGVLLFAMLTFELPFEGEGENLAKKVVHGELGSDKLLKVQEEDRDLILALLTQDPRLRLTMKELMNHEWLHDSSLSTSLPPNAAETSMTATPVPSTASMKTSSSDISQTSVAVKDEKRKVTEKRRFLHPLLKFVSSWELVKFF